MQITIFPLLEDCSSFQLNYPTEFSTAIHLEERDSTVKIGSGQLLLKECWFEGACLLSSVVNAGQHCNVKIQCDNFCWITNFVLEGALKTLSRPDQVSLGLEAGHYHTFYCSVLDMDLVIEQHTRIFTICLTQRFIRQFLGDNILPEQIEGNESELFFWVTKDDYRYNRFRSLIKEMLDAKQPAYIRRLRVPSSATRDQGCRAAPFTAPRSDSG